MNPHLKPWSSAIWKGSRSIPPGTILQVVTQPKDPPKHHKRQMSHKNQQNLWLSIMYVLVNDGILIMV